ncbi:MAG: type IV secretory system conjugative DNA transfer family protein [Streptococcus sanguinis]|nr:type IV secretory system conjugative DNA transfer family protein [Streptococcus sanguinis]
MFKVLEVIYYTLIQLAQVNLLNFLLIMGLVVYLLFQLFQFLLPIFKQGYQKFQQLLDPTFLQERLNKAKKVWKNRSLKRTVKYLQANFGKLIKGLFHKILALVFLIASNLLFRLFYLLPIVKRDRKRFEKEMKPILYFRSYRSMILMGVGFSLLVLFLTNYGVTLLRAVFHHIYLMVTNKNFSIPFPTESLLLQNLLNIRVFILAPIIAFPIFLFGEFIAWRSAWINFEQYRDYNGNEQGNDRFATAKEIHSQYKKVPNKQKTYPGNGGYPVLHETRNNLAGWTLRMQMIYQNRRFSKYLTNAEKILGMLSIPSGDFFVEDDTTSVLGIGMSRSGKGEGDIAPTLDINSRAETPPSMVQGDPKLEHYTSSYKIMRKRGFDVEVLNFQDMSWSMGYNPLALAVEAAKKGYYEMTQTYVNSVAEMIYPKSKGGGDKGNSEYFRKSSVSLFNALTMALMDRAHETIQNGEKDAWDTITIPNVAKFLTKLGSEEVFVNAQNEIVEAPEQGGPVTKKSKITVYFDNLRMVNRKQFSKFRAMADNEFRASDFGGEETKGNVYSSMVTGLNLFLQDNVAKLTSKNSIDLASVGFPRRLSIKFRSSSSGQLENTFAYQTAKVSITSTKKWGLKMQEVVHVKDATATVDEQGYLNFVIEPKLPDQFKIAIDFDYQNNDSAWVREQHFTLSAEKVYKKNGKIIQIDKYSKKKVLDHVAITDIEKPSGSLLELADIEVIYSDNPKIIYLGTPPHRSEYNALVSMFLHQLFNVNYELALANGGKCVNRILHLLDEFTNLPAIPDMDTKISIGLGQNILYYLWIQNLEQLVAEYGAETAQTIQDNCALHVYIKSTRKTNEKFSKELGTRTITVRNKAANILDEANPNVSHRGEGQPLLSPSQLAKLQEGERVIIRYVKGRDNQGFKSNLHPIFNHDKTAVPYRYMFLQEEFDRSMKPADIPVDSPHRNLNLQDIAVDAETGLTNLIQWRHDLSSCLSGGEAKLATRYKKQPQQASQQIYTAEEDLYEALAEEVLSDDYEGLFADDVI